MEINTTDSAQRCPACGAANRCVVATGGDIRDCWCAQPGQGKRSLRTDSPEARCLCPQCLGGCRTQD